jgi:hypothetical protein
MSDTDSLDGGTTPPDSLDGGLPPGGASQPCPQIPQFVSAQWVDEFAYCGDEVRLRANFTPACPDGPATISLLHPSTGNVVTTLAGNLRAGQVDVVWVAKAMTANWRTDTIRFRVQAAGKSGESSNKFAFKARPTAGWTLGDINRGTASGFEPVYETVDQSLEADRVHYSLKLKLIPEPANTPLAWDAAKQNEEKNRIQDVWNGNFNSRRFHRVKCKRGKTCDCTFDCCKLGYRLDVNFVASGEHFAVRLKVDSVGSCGTSRTGTLWTTPNFAPTSAYPHEVGHMLGQFDEYTGGADDPSGVQPTNPAEDNLMKTSGNLVLFNRHYRWVLEYLNKHTNGDQYEIIPP